MTNATNAFANEDFAALLDQSFGDKSLEGSVLKGTILRIDDDAVIVDVGLKSEGRIPKREFTFGDQEFQLKENDTVDVYVERYEDKDGTIMLSREKARREEAWVELEKKHEAGERVNGIISRRVKGGFTVDLGGAIAFLPGSQVDVRLVRDVGPLMGQEQPFQILKMERSRSNIVVSRRAVLEEDRAEARSELVDSLEEGSVVEGIVKNITDYGAFIDLGGVDGLLHVTDISWKRINHPSEVLNIGDSVKVNIIKFRKEDGRISLGMKQLEEDPWKDIQSKYPVDGVFKGFVTNITDYGAFVELEPGVEGLVHVSEMSWTRKNVHPGKIISTSQEVEVRVLEVDEEKRRVSLGIKQVTENPWELFANENPVGSVIEGEIRNITEFALFIALSEEIDGMIHLSDISWDKSGEEAIKEYEKGQVIKAKVLDADPEQGRISLGIKQLVEDPFAKSIEGIEKGQQVNVVINEVLDAGVNVAVENLDINGFIRKADLGKDRADQDTSKYNVGDVLEAKVTQIDGANRKVMFSIKALEIAQEKEAWADMNAEDNNSASLGDALKEALAKREAKS